MLWGNRTRQPEWYLSPPSEKQQQSETNQQEHKRTRPDNPPAFTAVASNEMQPLEASSANDAKRNLCLLKSVPLKLPALNDPHFFAHRFVSERRQLLGRALQRMKTEPQITQINLCNL